MLTVFTVYRIHSYSKMIFLLFVVGAIPCIICSSMAFCLFCVAHLIAFFVHTVSPIRIHFSSTLRRWLLLLISFLLLLFRDSSDDHVFVYQFHHDTHYYCTKFCGSFFACILFTIFATVHCALATRMTYNASNVPLKTTINIR